MTESDRSPEAPLFAETVAAIGRAVERRLAEDSIESDWADGLTDCVYLKNADGVLTFGNAAYRAAFAGGESPVGRHGRGLLDPTIQSVSEQTDRLVLSGCSAIDFDHVGYVRGGLYQLRSHKLDLRPLGKPGRAILGVTRVLHLLEAEDELRARRLDAAHSVYRSLEPRDQELCRLTALGLANADVAAKLEMSVRNVDLRRKKVLDAFGAESSIELVRLLVQLQERGYAELGL